MATHSSVLAWRIPGTVGPGGLPSMGSHRVGHDWSDLAAAAAGKPSVLQSQGAQRVGHHLTTEQQQIVDLQCCFNFCCTAKWFGYTRRYSFPLWFITGYWLSPVSHSRTVLFIHPMYNGLHLLNSLSSLPHLPSPLPTTSAVYVCESASVS